MGRIDLTHKQFNDWYVLSYAGNRLWNCQCSCGKVKQVRGELLRSGRSKSCGHSKDINYLKDKQFGQWTVQGIGEIPGTLLCKCSCGTLKSVRRTHLLDGTSLSCGHKQGIFACTTTKEQFVEQLNIATNNGEIKPTIHELADTLGLAYSTTARLIRQYDCFSYINLSKNQSELENKILDYIISITDSKYFLHNREILGGQELDIYFPDKRLAIECNGSYWHCEINKSKDYHQLKTIQCQKAGVRLIHIFDFEWYNDNNKIKSLLNSILGNNTVIYARNTEVKQINSTNESRDFLERNHLQGYVNASYTLGLYYNNELVEVMSFGIPRFDNTANYELIRLCTKAGYTVIGGASKLFSHATEHLNGKLITYCDLTKFDGRVYEQLGMSFSSLTAPNYVYVNLSTLETLSRYSCQKQKLLDKGYGTADMTEYEIMEQLGYVRIYNSGNACYEYKI